MLLALENRRIPPGETFRVTLSEPQAQMGEYYRAMFGKAGCSFLYTCSNNALFHCTVEFDVENEPKQRKVKIDGCTSWSAALRGAAERALDVIDAVRMQQHAGACYDACIAAKTNVSEALHSWYVKYATMTGESFGNSKSVAWDEAAHFATIRFTMLCISPDGNTVSRLPTCAQSVHPDFDTARDRAAERALLMLAGRPYTRDDVPMSVPLAPEMPTTPGKCAMDGVQCLYALCCARDRAKDSKLRPSYTAYMARSGKIIVNVKLPATGGEIAYCSPDFVVSDDDYATIDDANEEAAQYALRWIGLRIFDNHQFLPTAATTTAK